MMERALWKILDFTECKRALVSVRSLIGVPCFCGGIINMYKGSSKYTRKFLPMLYGRSKKA
jgi:hypothetical protein